METASAAAAAAAAVRTPDAPDAPDEFLCPIGCDLFEDPVMAADGHNYERENIEKWFRTRLTSPKTNAKLANRNLYPNHLLRSRCREWREAHSTKAGLKRQLKVLIGEIIAADDPAAALDAVRKLGPLLELARSQSCPLLGPSGVDRLKRIAHTAEVVDDHVVAAFAVLHSQATADESTRDNMPGAGYAWGDSFGAAPLKRRRVDPVVYPEGPEGEEAALKSALACYDEDISELKRKRDVAASALDELKKQRDEKLRKEKEERERLERERKEEAMRKAREELVLVERLRKVARRNELECNRAARGSSMTYCASEILHNAIRGMKFGPSTLCVALGSSNDTSVAFLPERDCSTCHFVYLHESRKPTSVNLRSQAVSHLLHGRGPRSARYLATGCRDLFYLQRKDGSAEWSGKLPWGFADYVRKENVKLVTFGAGENSWFVLTEGGGFSYVGAPAGFERWTNTNKYKRKTFEYVAWGANNEWFARWTDGSSKYMGNDAFKAAMAKLALQSEDVKRVHFGPGGTFFIRF